MKNVGKVFDTQCVWIQQYPEEINIDEEVKELILTDYACFKTKCGKCFYGYLNDDNNDFSDFCGETFVDWNCDEDVDYWKEWQKPDHPMNLVGNTLSRIEESDNLDSWFLLAILKETVDIPKSDSDCETKNPYQTDKGIDFDEEVF